MQADLTVLVSYRAEKGFGFGATAHERHSRIVGGWRAEIIEGLDVGELLYTGVNDTREGAIEELLDRMAAMDVAGRLEIVEI